MTVQKDLHKRFPFLAILLCFLPSLIFFLHDDTKWAILSLSLIPFFLICRDLYLLFLSEQGRRLHEVYEHLTEGEREHLKQLSITIGMAAGSFVGLSFVGTSLILRYMVGVLDYAYYILAFLVFASITLTLRRKAIMRFISSTEYARKKGWDNEL